MIKDFETGHHVRIKKAKRKKTAGEKRIIASRVAAYCVAASILSFTPAIIAGYDYSQDLRALDKEQKELYQLFMESGEYSQQIDNQLYQLADDYICGEIDYKTFRKRLNKMFTEETAKELLEISANEALKAQVAEIENQKQQRTEEFNSSAAITATMVGAAVGSAAAIASGAASIGYHIKENNEEKRKRKQEQNAGVKYYDSTTMTIRNTNGKDKEKKKVRKIELRFDYDETLDSIGIITEEQENQNTL